MGLVSVDSISSHMPEVRRGAPAPLDAWPMNPSSVKGRDKTYDGEASSTAALSRIASIAEGANRPHRDSSGIDWAYFLADSQREYISKLRGALGECARVATAALAAERLNLNRDLDA